MTLGNMRERGVQNDCLLPQRCLPAHRADRDLSSYPAETEVPSFGRRVVCAKCSPPWKQDRRSPELVGAA
jgi:hypothetical protein